MSRQYGGFDTIIVLFREEAMKCETEKKSHGAMSRQYGGFDIIIMLSHEQVMKYEIEKVTWGHVWIIWRL